MILQVARLVLCLGVPGLFSAHEVLKRAEPAPNAHLSSVPRELRLTFTAVPELAFSGIELLGPDSTPVPLGPLRLDSARTLIAEVRGALAAGTYTVAWRVAGRDGHPVRGRYSFSIAPDAEGVVAAAGTPPPAKEAAGRADEAGKQVGVPGVASPVEKRNYGIGLPRTEAFDAESPLYVVVRWLTFAGLLIVLGVVAFNQFVLGLLRRHGPPERETTLVQPAGRQAAALGLAAAACLGVLALLRLYSQSYATHGASGALDPALLALMLTGTVWGWGWLLHAAAILVAMVGFAGARLRGDRSWTLATLAAVALAFTPGLAGHAASAPRLTGVAIFADGLHVLGAAGWLGSLLAVVAVGIPVALRVEHSERGRAVADLVNAFSPTALVFAGLAAATGLFAGWLHLGSLSAVWESAYGQTLLVKVAILSVVAGIGAYNWRRVRPALGDLAGAARLRRSASAELAFGALVLLVTAVLVATPPPREDMATQRAQSTPG